MYTGTFATQVRLAMAEAAEDATAHLKPFRIEPHRHADKSFRIECPGDLSLDVDYDDVDHEEVDGLAVLIVSVLNRYWELNCTP
jgi:hypothetical protein